MSELHICDKCGASLDRPSADIEAKLDYSKYAFCPECGDALRKQWEAMRRDAYRLAGERMASGH